MKIKISFTDQETHLASGLEQLIVSFFSRVKIKRSEAHPPYRHTYIEINRS